MASGPYAVLWSGGKDSCLALYEAMKAGMHVAALANFYDADSSRVRFHAVRASLIAAQADALGVTALQIATSPAAYAQEFSKALANLKGEGYEGVIAGDIHLSEVRAWNQHMADHAGLRLIEPLWHQSGRSILDNFVNGRFRAVLTCCDNRWKDLLWPGREIDSEFVEAILRVPEVDPCGENGEYHSFVFDGPIFSQPLAIALGDRRDSAAFSQIDVTLPTGT